MYERLYEVCHTIVDHLQFLTSSPTPPNHYFSRLGSKPPNYVYVLGYFIRLEKNVPKCVWVNLSCLFKTHKILIFWVGMTLLYIFPPRSLYRPRQTHYRHPKTNVYSVSKDRYSANWMFSKQNFLLSIMLNCYYYIFTNIPCWSN